MWNLISALVDSDGFCALYFILLCTDDCTVLEVMSCISVKVNPE